MSRIPIISSAVSIILLVGCSTTPKEVPPPNFQPIDGMSITDAMAVVKKAILDISNDDREPKLGFVLQQVQAQFTIKGTETTTNGQQLVVGVSTPVTASGQLSSQEAGSLEKDNTVTITYQNPLFSAPNGLVWTSLPEEIKNSLLTRPPISVSGAGASDRSVATQPSAR